MADALFSPIDISIKIAISVGIGMLVGLEREWSQKDLGARTFAIAALAGTLSILSSPGLAYISFAGILLIILLTGLRNLREGKPVETTTAAAVLSVFILGTLVGQGHHYTPVAAAVVMTLLLAFKPALRHFAGDLQVKEVQSALLLGLLAFVIYPALPNRTIDPWRLVNPREAWLTVVVIAAIGFVNYVLLKLYRARGLYYSAILGGMVNSTATIAELAGFLRTSQNPKSLTITIDLLTVVAMFLRNLLIVAIFAHAAAAVAALPLIVMSLVALVCIWWQRKYGSPDIGVLQLSSPLSLTKVLEFGAIFLAIQILGDLGQRYFGHFGFLVVTVIGGFISSASTVGAAAILAARGEIPPATAGAAAVLTSMASSISNLPLLFQQIRDWPILRKLSLISAAILGAGIITLLLQKLV